MNIVAIGGGERTPHMIKALDLTGEEKPRALIIPSAASTQSSFDKKVGIYSQAFEELGVTADVLHQYGEMPSKDEIDEKIGNADLLYTFGGNSPYMIRTLAEQGSDKAIFDAVRKGKVHAGLSAGALLPFRLALSNPVSNPSEVDWEYEYLEPGVNLIDAVATAHADQHDPRLGETREDSRMDAFVRTFPHATAKGFAISNNASAIFGDNAEVFTTKPEAFVNVVERDNSGTVAVRPANTNDLRL